MADQPYNFLSGGNPLKGMGAIEATRIIKQDPQWRLNVSLKQQQLEMNRAQLHDMAAKREMAVKQRQGISNLNTMMAGGIQDPNAALRGVYSTANSFLLTDEQIKPYVDFLNQSINRNNALNALNNPPDGYNASVTHGPNGPSVSLTQQQRPERLRIIDEAESLRAAAEILRKQGDAAGYQEMMRKSELISGTVSQQTESISGGLDDQGRPIFNITRGGSGGKLPPTVGTQSRVQEKNLHFRSALSMLKKLDGQLREEDVGVSGWVGRRLIDQGLAQVFPNMADPERISSQTMLTNAREIAMKALTADTRITEADAKRMMTFLPSDEALTSLTSEKVKIKTIRDSMRNLGRQMAIEVGDPIPMYSYTSEELQQWYNNTADEIDSRVRQGYLTEEQGKAAKRRNYDTAKQTMEDYL